MPRMDVNKDPQAADYAGVRSIRNGRRTLRRSISVLSMEYLATEDGDAPDWPGTKSEHIGNIRAIRNAARRAAAPAEWLGSSYAGH